jgi:hypothetical protein
MKYTGRCQNGFSVQGLALPSVSAWPEKQPSALIWKSCLAAGEPGITRPSPLNVLKDTY